MLKMVFIFILGSAAAAEGEPAGDDDTTSVPSETGVSGDDTPTADEEKLPDISDPAPPLYDDEVEEIVVTGTRGARRRSDDPMATKVVDRATIEASGAEDVADLLQQVPGVDVQQGFLGSELRLQGMDPDQVLIMVDGQRMNGRVGGAIDLSRIPVDSIERIEIVEGTASALYGADAMGGVVHIITRKGSDEFSGTVHGRGGNIGTIDGSGGVSMGTDGATLRLDAGVHRNAAYDRNPADPATTGDANTQGQFSGRGDLDIGNDGAVALLGSYSRRDQQGVDGTGEAAVFDRRNLIEEVRATVDPRWVTDANGQLTGHLGVSYYRDQYVLDQRGAATLDDAQETQDTLVQAGVQMQRLYATHDIVVGVEGLLEALSTERLEEGSAQRQRIGAYIQDEWRTTRRVRLLPSVRADTDTTFGTWPTARLATRIDPVDAVHLRASVGNGFRAPNFREQYLRFANPSVGYVIEGNPDLEPEQSLQASAGVEVTSDVVEVGVSGWWNEVSQLIALGTISEQPGNQRFGYVNISDARVRGGEGRLGFKVGKQDLSLAYTLTDAWDKDLDRVLEGRALHRGTANLNLRTDGGGTRFTARTVVVGPRTFYSDALDPAATVETSPTYAEVDLRAQQAIIDEIAVFAGVDNLLDAGDADRLPLTPRLFYAGIDGRFGASSVRGTP